jgi:hypothetical protein
MARDFQGDTPARFYVFDSTLYRDSDDTLPNEAWIDGRWQHVIPSEQDYNGMREVAIERSFEEAFLNASGEYEDGKPLDLGRHGTLDPSGEIGLTS